MKEMRGTREQRRDLIESRGQALKEKAEVSGQKRGEQQIFRTVASQAGPGATEADVKKYFTGTAATGYQETAPTTTMRMEKPGFFGRLLGDEPTVRQEIYHGRPEYTEDRRSGYIRPPDMGKVEEVGKQEAAQLKALSKIQLETSGSEGVAKRFAAGEFMTPEKVMTESKQEFDTLHAREGAKLEAQKAQYETIKNKYIDQLQRAELDLKTAQTSKDDALTSEAKAKTTEINQKITKESKLQGLSEQIIGAKTPEEQSRLIDAYDAVSGNSHRISDRDDRRNVEYSRITMERAKIMHDANLSKDPVEQQRLYGEANKLDMRRASVGQDPNVTIEFGRNTQGQWGTNKTHVSEQHPRYVAEAYYDGRLMQAARSGQPITLKNGVALSGAQSLIKGTEIEVGKETEDIKSAIAANREVHPEVKAQALEMINEREKARMEQGKEHGDKPGAKKEGGARLGASNPLPTAIQDQSPEAKKLEERQGKESEGAKATLRAKDARANLFNAWLVEQLKGTGKTPTQLSTKEIEAYKKQFDAK